MEQHYIGILLSSQLYRQLDQGKKPQILSFYEEAGKINSIIPVYLRLEDLQPGESQSTGYVLYPSGEYGKTTIPKPLVIH